MDAASFLVAAAAAGTRELPGMLAFRLLPFAAFIAISRSFHLLVRIVVIGAYGLVLYLATLTGTPTHWILIAYLYFSAAGWVAHELSSYVHWRVAYLACALLLFWVLPVVAIRPIHAVILVPAWDCILGAYSYHVDTQKQRDRSLRDFLFFLLINPVLVYRNRGRRDASPALDIGGLLRVALGLFAMFFSVGLLAALHSQALTIRETQDGIAGVGAILVVGALRLAREYAVHSGVASLQIGVMRQLGWTIPERYVYPLLARSPAEFWRRWNTYVGDWARIYVFLPLARALGRRAPKNWRSVGLPSAAAVVLTFGVVGVLHDLYIVTVQRELVAPATAWFLAMGLVVVLWHAFAARVRGRQAPMRWGQEVERVVFLCCACAAAYLW